jgi:hypothetical protein
VLLFFSVAVTVSVSSDRDFALFVCGGHGASSDRRWSAFAMFVSGGGCGASSDRRRSFFPVL